MVRVSCNRKQVHVIVQEFVCVIQVIQEHFVILGIVMELQHLVLLYAGAMVHVLQSIHVRVIQIILGFNVQLGIVVIIRMQIH
jgi:hypothetical protein